MDIVSIIALVFLIISWVIAASNAIKTQTIPSSLDWAVWSIAILAVFRNLNLS